MKNKYDDLQNEFNSTTEELAKAAGWTQEQAAKILSIITGFSQKQTETAVKKSRETKKDSKFLATKKLLQNYRNLRASINCGMEHSLKLLEDSEYQRLMEKEESVRNQKLTSMALLTASNQVLWTRLNTALDCYKEMCKNDPSPTVRRGYPIIQALYLGEYRVNNRDLMERFAVEQAQYYRSINIAISTLSVIIFGSDSPEDFCVSRNL